MSYLIGIDVGTTGTKTILVDEQGNQLASALEEYPLHTPSYTIKDKCKTIFAPQLIRGKMKTLKYECKI